ncbi:MAG: Type 1 glutamine amidotransferase-like domain-containing protein [Leptolyngbyaceae cyanobacterium]
MTQIKQQIIALGGGGFSMEPENPLLDRYILQQSNSQLPKICFLPTASGDSDRYITRFYEAFTPLACRSTHLSLFRPPTDSLTSLLQDQDIIYVGGGSTFNLMALWKAWKLDVVLRQVWERGTVLCGLSAGSLCWFDAGLSDSVIPGQYAELTGLGFLPGSHCPHYDGERGRRPIYQQCISAGKLADGVAADDGVALHYIGTELARVVSSRPAAKAYRVYLENGRLQEDAIAAQYLG